ncbi:FecR family protein [Pseudomonas quasicaspiana]|uniref:FecR family protein n=1 Tax=Pseudomonas quasicaspiana TaxID=2829821 RepID=UPI001E4EEE58|nr:FecR family protein [Pseudomonas quasicaspiana]MCD5979574.1 FecR family protein [Pseudomonas quasicaspiana]
MHELKPSRASLEQASDWLLELQAEPARFEEFDHWLHASPEHLSAWAQVNRAWSAIEQPSTTAHWPAATAVVQLKPSRRRWSMLAAACVCVIAVGVAWLNNPDWQADYHTGTGETRVVKLKDGSQLTLAARSAVDVDYSGNTRRITLLSGEALFDVVHDARRPFQVDASNVVIRVLGTSFDVARSETGIKVEVREGAVGVSANGSPYRLGAGQRLWFDAVQGSAQQAAIAPDEIATWVSGQQFFENATVQEVVEQLRKYQHGWIVIGDDALGQKRVTGLYDLRDTQRALQALAKPIGGTLVRYSPLLTVLK